MNNKVYVTFQVKFIHEGVKKYAIECKNLREAREIAADVNSFDGVTYDYRAGKPTTLVVGVVS